MRRGGVFREASGQLTAAVKVQTQSADGSGSSFTAFLCEAFIHFQFHHPHVVRGLFLAVEPGSLTPHFGLEFCSNGNVLDLLQTGQLSWHEIMRAIVDSADGEPVCSTAAACSLHFRCRSRGPLYVVSAFGTNPQAWATSLDATSSTEMWLLATSWSGLASVRLLTSGSRRTEQAARPAASFRCGGRPPNR